MGSRRDLVFFIRSGRYFAGDSVYVYEWESRGRRECGIEFGRVICDRCRDYVVDRSERMVFGYAPICIWPGSGGRDLYDWPYAGRCHFGVEGENHPACLI